MVNFKFKGLSK